MGIKMIGRCCSFFLRLEDQCFHSTALSSACEKERPPPSPGASRCTGHLPPSAPVRSRARCLPRFGVRCTFSGDPRSWWFEEAISFLEEDSRHPAALVAPRGHRELMAGIEGLHHKEQPLLLPAPDAESGSEMTWTPQTKCTPASFLAGVRQEKQTRALKYEI